MSELPYYLSPTPADEPIATRGNALWRGNERFLIKGISYRPRKPGVKSRDRESFLDPLTDERLPELEKDISLIRELGLNSVLISSLSPAESHYRALKRLEKAGIYVTVYIFEDIEAPPLRPASGEFNSNFDPTPYYHQTAVTNAFRLVDQLAEHPNVLGFAVDGRCLQSPGVSKIVEALRAGIRDTKAFLQTRLNGRGRGVPVGISLNDRQSMKIDLSQYFSAGSPDERADFFAHDSWSWAGPSSFQVSGWKNMVDICERTSPIPAFLSAYGTNVRRPRVWDEILCLYSHDMTRTHSGGFVYTLIEGGNGHGLAKVGENGKRVKMEDFAGLKQQLREVNARLPEDIMADDVRDYES